jgi:hypothetical protein
MCTSTVYRIVVHGELSERYAIAFEGMEVKREVKDQAQLHGILDLIGSLGLKLVSGEDLTER